MHSCAEGLTRVGCLFRVRRLGDPPLEPLKHAVTHFLLQFHGTAGYVGVFSLLVACGLGLPLPEDIALITGGLLASLGPPLGVPSVTVMVIVGLAGILIGDSVIFKAGHDYGDKLLGTRLGKHIPAESVGRVRALFGRHGSKFIMVARFLPGVRAVTYFVAGTSGVPYWQFVLYDGLAACASAPAWVLMGYWCGKHHMIRQAWKWASQFQLALLGALGVLLIIAVVFFMWRKRHLQRRKLALAAQQSGLGSVGVETPGNRERLEMSSSGAGRAAVTR